MSVDSSIVHVLGTTTVFSWQIELPVTKGLCVTVRKVKGIHFLNAFPLLYQENELGYISWLC